MVNPATHVESLFKGGRYETSASPGAAAVVATFYATRHRDTTAVVTNPKGGQQWATEFAQQMKGVGVDCAIEHTDAGVECHITYRGVRVAAE